MQDITVKAKMGMDAFINMVDVDSIYSQYERLQENDIPYLDMRVVIEMPSGCRFMGMPVIFKDVTNATI